jgi:hypothetical protein
MAESILDSIKKVLGVPVDYTEFDPDILMHVNTVFSTLTQLGVGPTTGFMIEDRVPTWDQFLGTDINLNGVKTYVYLCVRTLFDPPSSAYLLTAMKEQIQELEWRLNTYRESTAWVSPFPPPEPVPDLFADKEVS